MSGTLRFRAFLDRWFTVVAALLVVSAAIGGWATYATHAAPETTTEQRVDSSWNAAGDFEHGATVTENNSVYPLGTTLTNRSVYFHRIAPELNGSFDFAYGASEGGELDVAVDLYAEHRAVEERDGEETVVWRRTRPLAETTADAVRPGETTTVPFAVDVRELRNETDRIENELGGTRGEAEVLVRADVRVTGTVNGEEVNRTLGYSLPVQFDGGAYRIEGETAEREEFASTSAVAVERTRSPVASLGAPLTFLASLIGIGALASVRRRGTLIGDDEREVLAYRDDRSEFDEWISTMSLPDRIDDLPRAEAESLADLANFAIDADRGVVHDPDRGEYLVLRDGTVYAYEPPRRIDEVGDAATVDGHDADVEPDDPEIPESKPVERKADDLSTGE